jgi:hypothetical protein
MDNVTKIERLRERAAECLALANENEPIRDDYLHAAQMCEATAAQAALARRSSRNGPGQRTGSGHSSINIQTNKN